MSTSYWKDHDAKVSAVQEGSRRRKQSKTVLEMEITGKEETVTKKNDAHSQPEVQK
jgi:hypothetical protein